ncbi:MAG: carbamoyltransferase [Candidatus Binataceae bacterium]|nr:carbamoyltransferase [Candidatus Binataceae bacterium]
MLILGVNAYHGDASAAAIVDGQLVAAIEEERLTRVKHAAGFPARALAAVASAAGARATGGTRRGEIRTLAVARDPWARLGSKAWHALKVPSLAMNRIGVQSRFARIAEAAARPLAVAAEGLEIHRVEHHQAHLASSFFVSPYDQAALYSIDGMGDFASAAWGVGRGPRIEPLGAVAFPHSIGIFYTALTQYLGFPNYGDEYKVMGLASYGEPEYLDEMRRMVSTPSKPAARRGPLGFALDPAYFLHHRASPEMTWDYGAPRQGRLYADYLVERLGPPRDPAGGVDQRHRNIAASLQRRLEEVMLGQLRGLHSLTGMRRLCLAGGVAFNCVANGKIRAATGFDEVYIQSAAGDAGLAIGAAMYAWHHTLGHRRGFVMEHANWGPAFGDGAIAAALRAARGELERQDCVARRIDDEGELCTLAAAAIARGEVVGWFQGRMEWGPRALGNRSILADPRRPEMRAILNAKIKRRELFRPFAPSIAEEAAHEYFEQSYPSPFMLMAYAVRPAKRAVIPATTHVDGSGRLQTVNPRQNPLYYRLIKEFGRQTGVPVLLNTSFNENEPVVCRPEEALDCFLRTRMDLLVMGRTIVSRASVHPRARAVARATELAEV